MKTGFALSSRTENIEMFDENFFFFLKWNFANKAFIHISKFKHTFVGNGKIKLGKLYAIFSVKIMKFAKKPFAKMSFTFNKILNFSQFFNFNFKFQRNNLLKTKKILILYILSYIYIYSKLYCHYQTLRFFKYYTFPRYFTCFLS